MSTEELFKDKEYCLKQIVIAREVFGNKNTTKAKYEQMEKCLAMMYLYCPSDICEIVLTTMNELELRKVYFLKIW